MKSNSKGFTLIELLAVIVILAVIALIATPLIMGVIDDARKGSAKNGAYGYVKAMENTIATEMIKGVVTPGTVDKAKPIDYKGTAPDRHTLKIVNGTVGQDSTITISGYSFKMDANGEWQEDTATE